MKVLLTINEAVEALGGTHAGVARIALQSIIPEEDVLRVTGAVRVRLTGVVAPAQAVG